MEAIMYNDAVSRAVWLMDRPSDPEFAI